MTLAPFDPKHSLHQELLQTHRLRRRQADVSFYLALGITVVGAVYLLKGHPEGGLPASAGVGISLISLRFAKDANDRLDKLATELKDE